MVKSHSRDELAKRYRAVRAVGIPAHEAVQWARCHTDVAPTNKLAKIAGLWWDNEFAYAEAATWIPVVGNISPWAALTWTSAGYTPPQVTRLVTALITEPDSALALLAADLPIIEWRESGFPADRACLYAEAGITPTEATTHEQGLLTGPDLEQALRLLAALRHGKRRP